MLLKEIVKNKTFLIIIFILVFLVIRLPLLGYDSINPDGVNWHYRSEQFVVGLKTFQLEKTYQHYHPGVTLMWITGASVEFVKQFVPGHEIYDHLNFLTFHSVAKNLLVLVHLILTLITFMLLKYLYSITDRSKAFIISFSTIFLLSVEPFFVGNSRMLHMDVLLTLLLFNGLVSTYIANLTRKKSFFVLSGLFLGLSFLTKSIGVGLILYALGYTLYISYVSGRLKRDWIFTILLLVSSILTTYLFFPALWKSPIGVIINIFDEADRIGLRNGHGQIFFEAYTRDPGPVFYFYVLLMKLSPFAVFGLLYLIPLKLKSIKFPNLKQPSFEIFLIVFYIGYLAVMLYSSKKLDRYMLPLFPPLILFSVLGYYSLFDFFKQNFPKFKSIYFSLFAGLLAITFIVFPLYTYFPYYFTYVSPLFKNPETANKVIGQKPFGIGIPLLKEVILEEYGDYPKLGFIDTKPMRSIYMNSRIFDIRVSGTRRYDLLILGINEEFPEEVLTSGTVFRHDRSVYINNLEYWRIYVKED